MEVIVQVAARPPAADGRAAEFRAWADAVSRRAARVCVRIVGEEESAALNLRYRGRAAAANVLSFPFEAPPAPVERDYIGDIVLAAPVVAGEARRDSKTLKSHWAHLFVHGLLHLHGYRHDTAADAERMEARESGIMCRLGFADPWAAEQTGQTKQAAQAGQTEQTGQTGQAGQTRHAERTAQVGQSGQAEQTRQAGSRDI